MSDAIRPWTPPDDMPIGRGPDSHTSFKFEAELIGGHVHVKVRAGTRHPSVQVDHSRGLCGELVMSPGEWLLFRAMLDLARTPNPLWLMDRGGKYLAPAGPPWSFHDDQRFIEVEGWPDGSTD